MQSEVIRQISTRRRQINRQKCKIGMDPSCAILPANRGCGVSAAICLRLAALHDAELAISAAFGIECKGVLILTRASEWSGFAEDYARWRNTSGGRSW